MKTDTDLMC